MDINRDALLLYLRDLRDLEMAKYHIGNMIAREEANYRSVDAQLQQTNYWEARPEGQKSKEIIPNSALEIIGGLIKNAVGGILFGAAGLGMAVGAVIAVHDFLEGEKWIFGGFFKWSGIILMSVLGLLFGIMGVGFLLYPIFTLRENLSENSEAKKKNEEIQKENEQIRARNQDLENRVRQHNAEEQVRQNQNAQRRVQLRQKWNERKQFLENEMDKVEGLLGKAYSENILAKDYRDLAPLYYIYDYMSTSRASFDDTLMHAHMESGFQRILARLDEIVENQAMQLFSLRRMEAQNREQIEQNYSMLDSLDRMDRNNRASFSQMNSTLGGIRDNTYQTSQYAKQASQYAGIAATYSAANAYFSLANYLKN